ncbi:hypothetical protein [Methylomonas sp. MgM2]
MENLQRLMPYFQDQLSQWYQMTMERPDYAAAIAVSVWLLMAIFYSIRIGFLKKDIDKLTKLNTENQASLNSTQEQVQTLQQQLKEAATQTQSAVEKAEAESERASAIEQRLSAGNRELVASLAKLVECFELNVHNLPEANADNLLPEYQAIIGRVAERFQNEQKSKTELQLSFHAESAKLAEKEMLISSLQHRLDNQTQQLAHMELAIEQYESAQRQLEADREQQLTAAMAKQQAEAAKLAELKRQEQEAKQAKPSASLLEQEVDPLSASVKPAEPVATPAENIPPGQPKPELGKPQAASEAKHFEGKAQPKAATAKPREEGRKFKGFFSKAMEKIAQMDEKLGTQTSDSGEPETESDEPLTGFEPEPVKTAQERKESVDSNQKSKSTESVTAKMSGLFGGFKKSSAKPSENETESLSPASAAPEQLSAEQAEKLAKPDKKIPSQLTGWFGKLKSKK